MRLIETIKQIIKEGVVPITENKFSIIAKTFEGDPENLYKYLIMRNQLDSFLIDMVSDEDSYDEVTYNTILQTLISSKDNHRLIKHTAPGFPDIEVRNDKVIMVLNSADELTKFFYSDRNMGTDWIENILVGEGDFYSGSDFSEYISIEDDILDSLNDVNLKELKDLMLEQGFGEYVNYDGDNEMLSDVISQDDGELTKETFDEIFMSNSTIADALIGIDFFEGLKDNLRRIYNYSYESALESEAYNNVYEAIENFFGSKHTQVDTGKTGVGYHRNGDKYTYSIVNTEIDVTNIYTDVIQYIIDEGQDLWYYGGFETVLEEYCDNLSYQDSLSASYPDYADSTILEKDMNEIFTDYIHDY